MRIRCRLLRTAAALLIPALLLAGLAACWKQAPAKREFRIAVFIPGVAAGSPIYEKLVAGAEKAVAESPKASLKVVEGGFNQAEWPEKVTALAASGEYELLVTSNPSMPDICAEVGAKFPRQKFLVLDGFLKGNPQIYTLLYNQVELGYLVGYLGGLVSKGRVGMIVAQQYPVMDRAIRPGFEQGLKAANPVAKLDFRVIGNWFDAQRAADLAGSMFDTGVDVILTIAGGAMQGVVRAAQERGRRVLWFESDAYAVAPGTIIGCGVLRQDRGAYEKVKQAIAGTLPFGKAEVYGAREGYIDFLDEEGYRRAVPQEIRERFAPVIQSLRTGKLRLPMPEF